MSHTYTAHWKYVLCQFMVDYILVLEHTIIPQVGLKTGWVMGFGGFDILMQTFLIRNSLDQNNELMLSWSDTEQLYVDKQVGASDCVMIPLSDFVVVWQILSSLSQWVLKAIRKGYRI